MAYFSDEVADCVIKLAEIDQRSMSWIVNAAAEEAAKLYIPVAATDSIAVYLERFWLPDGDYARARAARGHQLSAEYLANSHAAIVRHVLPHLRHRHIATLSPEVLETMLMYFHRHGMSARRVNTVRQAIGVPLAEAVRLGRLVENPMAKVPRLAETPAPREILTPEEARAVLAAIPDGPLRLINMLAAATGMRLGECLGLQAGDIERSVIHICHNWQHAEGMKAPKMGGARMVPAPQRLCQSLRSLAAANPWGNGFVFYGTTPRRPMAERIVQRAYVDACHAAGISEAERRRRRLSFHAWRHWYVSMMRGTLSDAALRQLTRHQSQEMLDHYTTVTDEQRKAAARVAGRLLEK